MWPFRKSNTPTEEKTFSPTVLGTTPGKAPHFSEKPHEFKKKFDLELESWCYGLETLNETPLPQVVFRVIRELRPTLREAIASGFAFDIRLAAEKLYFSAKRSVPRKEILFALLAILPDPETLTAEEKRTFTIIVAQVELLEGGAVERVRQRWNLGREGRGNLVPIPVSTPRASEHSS